MTITLQAVNELIQSLESAGELSIKETKVLALAKAYQQLAAENVGLKALIPENWQMHDVLHQLIVDRPGGVYFNKWEKLIIGVLNETHATDRIVAGIKADGVESGIKTIMTMLNHQAPGVSDAINVLRVHSSELREGAK
ncbi:TPA: hypothetical protein ACTYTR_004404 [Klebsiella michiganensis]|uniref:hypothetical protein n=1 Tax=Klebsiella michiganensis TaxID=1134687 RepID=UPI0009B6A1C4|nr:hypothetical protein [Klebsiella michiganensis]ARB24656.1 hypothetical protein AM394_27200 [Klebsiella oxytoca]MDM4122141.1 hypothetical protein [Klebsiella michiganensis]MDM4159029.1 hypothetical protein [Klebsiella michiganensis]MDS7752202.1 hypothetical protein [Klebsiella michiganensis]QUG49830.1 hypothetical protein KDU73_21490 [Klebsiella michiganensis]